MKRHAFLLAGLLGLAALLPGGPPAEAAPVTVKVCGEAPGEAAAKEDARRKAVDRVLIQMQLPEAERLQILARYADYASMPEVVSKKQQGAKLYLIGRVRVDADAIQAALAAQGSLAQERQEDLSACFLLRVQGIADESLASRGLRRALEVSGDTFQQRGFATDISDELARELLHQPGDYGAFRQRMQQKIQQDYPEITVAIVGEICLEPVSRDGTGCTSGATIRVYALDILRQRVVAEYEEAYQAKCATAEEADLVALQKAALNAAETLAGKSLQYYRNA